MTSVLNVDTIADKAGTGPVGLTKQVAAKAYANFNGTGTAAVRDSFNLSSLADNGTGDFTTSFSSSFSNNDYTVGGTTRSPGVASGGVYNGPSDSDSDQATGSLRGYTITTTSGSVTVADVSYCFPQFIGDLA